MREPTNPERDAQVRALARACATKPMSERAGFLESQCADAAIRNEVVRMLARQADATLVGEEAGGSSASLKSDSDSRANATEDAARPGLRRLGPYTILDVLGEGGMGTVYLAEQERPRRTVALKVVRPALLTARMLKRFEHESEMLARLQHPGIAQVYEASSAPTEHGPQPYFAMEHVRGVPLTDFAESRGLSARARIELFMQVCEAVQHAHQKGVIHRDLKPGNILVSSEGRAKVLDFGIARATDGQDRGATMMTGMGEIVGTLPYMSPEQIAGNSGDLDTRSDVYTLGVILYELLSGRLPHAVSNKTIVEASRIITQTEPPPLERVAPALKGDVATIVAKAMEKDRGRRYASASELASDLARYLNDEPVTARPASRVYQMTKFAKRNKPLVGGIVATAVVLIAGIAGTTYQAIAATRERVLAEQRKAEAEAATARAKVEAENAGAVSQFLNRMFTSIDPEKSGDKDVTVRQVLDSVSAGVEAEQSAGKSAERPPKVEVAIRGALANSYRGLAMYDKAAEHARAAVQIAERGLGPDDEDSIEAHRLLGYVLALSGKPEEGLVEYRKALDGLRRTVGAGSAPEQIVAADIARVESDMGSAGASIPKLREAWRVVCAAKGDSAEESLSIANHLGTALAREGQFAESEEVLGPALERSTRALGPEHSQTLHLADSMAATCQKAGRNREASEVYARLLEVRTRLYGADHQRTLTVKASLVACLVGAGEQAKAEPIAREVLAAFERTLGEGNVKTQAAMGNLAFLLEDLGKDDEAESLYRRTIELKRAGRGIGDPETWSTMNNFAMMLQRRGRADEADRLLAELVAICDEKLPKEHYVTALFRNNWGDVLTDLKKYEQAEVLLRSSTTVIEKTFKPAHARSVKARGRLVRLYEAWGKPDKAEEIRRADAGG